MVDRTGRRRDPRHGDGTSSGRDGKGSKPRSTVKPMIAGRPEAQRRGRRRVHARALPGEQGLPRRRHRDRRTHPGAGRDGRPSSRAPSWPRRRTPPCWPTGKTRSARATTLHERYDRLRRMLITDAVRSYQSGHAATDDESTRDLVAAAARALDDATRAELQVGTVAAAQDRAKVDYDRFMRQYFTAQQDLGDIDQRLERLAKQRAAALAAAQAAKSGDLARNRQSIAESGQLGAQIRAASARLAAAGRTVQGTGDFSHPSSGSHHVALWHADAPDPALREAAHRHGLRCRRRVRARRRQGTRAVHHRQRRLRQLHGGRPRHDQRPAHHDRVCAPGQVPGQSRARSSRRARRSASSARPAMPPGRTCTSRSATTVPSRTRCPGSPTSPSGNRPRSACRRTVRKACRHSEPSVHLVNVVDSWAVAVRWAAWCRLRAGPAGPRRRRAGRARTGLMEWPATNRSSQAIEA